MHLNTSYRQILSISVPIMLGSAAQNIIVLCDNFFLLQVSDVDFAAVGLVGVFYLIVASIGYGFSRGGQVLIARRHGEKDYRDAGNYLKALLFFEMALAVVMFVFLQLCSDWFFNLTINDPIIHQKCLEYIYPRSWGVFFSYTGVAFIAFYTGIARTRVILINTAILIVINIFLNYVFIFGKFGLEPMGIRGAGLASTIAEGIAFICFIGYMAFDNQNIEYKLWKFKTFTKHQVYKTSNISFPIVWQSIIGLGSWYVFFALIEKMGTDELEISNLLRNVYLILSVPCWGYSAGINTLVSNFIGNRKRQAVIPITQKTALLNLITTLIFALPIALWPEFLYPIFSVTASDGTLDLSLINDSKEYFPLIVIILSTFAVGSTYMNALMGTGRTLTALWIQSIFVVVYVIYSFIVISVLKLNLFWAWSVEIVYWLGILIVVLWYLKSKKWHSKMF